VGDSDELNHLQFEGPEVFNQCRKLHILTDPGKGRGGKKGLCPALEDRHHDFEAGQWKEVL